MYIKCESMILSTCSIKVSHEYFMDARRNPITIRCLQKRAWIFPLLPYSLFQKNLNSVLSGLLLEHCNYHNTRTVSIISCVYIYVHLCTSKL